MPTLYHSFCAPVFCPKTEEWENVPKRKERKKSYIATKDLVVTCLISVHQNYSQKGVEIQWTKWLGDYDWFSKGKLCILSTSREWWRSGRALGVMVWKIQIFPFVLCFVECFPHVHTALWHFYYRLLACLCSITAMDWASLDPFKSPAAFSVSFSFLPDA